MLLHQYARTGDIAGLTRELARRTDVEARDERTDRTPLMEAVVSPQAGTDVVRLLIAHGADVNATHSKLKRTVLSLAVGAGALGKARALLDAGANIRYRRPKQYTVLLDALHGRQIGRDPDLVPLVRLLIERGAALDTASDYGESALGVASRLGRFDVVQLLLQAGADPAPLRWTSLMEAIALGSLADAQEQIAGGADLTARDRWGRTPWLLSLQVGDVDKAKLLMASGADYTELGPKGQPSLVYPIANGHLEMLRWLLAEGFDPNEADHNGKWTCPSGARWSEAASAPTRHGTASATPKTSLVGRSGAASGSECR